MSYADLQRKLHWQQLFGLLDKLPIWAGYFFAILCSFGMGYSLGSSNSSFPDPYQESIHARCLNRRRFATHFVFGSDTTQRRASACAARGTAQTQ